MRKRGARCTISVVDTVLSFVLIFCCSHPLATANFAVLCKVLTSTNSILIARMTIWGIFRCGTLPTASRAAVFDTTLVKELESKPDNFCFRGAVEGVCKDT